MFYRFILLFFLILISRVATAQIHGVEVVGTIDLVKALPPPLPSGKTIWLNLILDQPELTSPEVERLRHLQALGYRLALQFPGPKTGFSTTEQLLATADTVRHLLPIIGKSYSACVIGNPDHPLSQNILDQTVGLSFALKSMALACRSGNPQAEVYLGLLNSTLFSSYAPLLSTQSLNAYIDGYLTTAADFKSFQILTTDQHPNAVVFSREESKPSPHETVKTIFSAFQQERYHLFVPIADTSWKPFLSLMKFLSRDTSPTAAGDRPAVFLSASGEPLKDYQGFNFTSYQTREVHVAIIPPDSSQPFYYVIPSSDIAEPVLHDIIGEKDYPLKVSHLEKEDKSYIGLPGLRWPMLLSYKSAGKEEYRYEEISGAYDLPLEIIMARVQAVEAAQREALKNYQADARIEYHFRLPGGYALIDVAYDNEFYFDPVVNQEWRQKMMYINGVPWKGKKIPELPIPESEQVVSLPLNLTLNKDYEYRLLGSENVDGKETWIIEFVPASQKPLYKGKVWIDRKTFHRVKVSATQTQLTTPITSSDETLYFELHDTPTGVVNLVSTMQGQQIFSAGGRQVFSERTIRFENFLINSQDFNMKRSAAYASNDLMMRQTNKGLRPLRKDSKGDRIVQWNLDTTRKFWVFGTFYDQALGFPFPFGGKNILNYNWRNSGTQLNMLLAGALNVLSLSDPEFIRKGWDSRVELAIFTVPTVDRIYQNGTAAEADDLWLFREFGNVGLGFTVGEYGKITPGLQFGFYHYFRASETAEDFEIPSTHFDLAPTLELNYTRKGFSLSAAVASHYRTNWENWGIPESEGQLNPQKQYWQFQSSFNKTFYPADFHKIGFSITYLKGKDLDRFSSYQFFYLGDLSLAGFSGSGIRFQEGTLTKGIYQFNVFDLFRVGGRLEFGLVQPLFETRREKHGGIGADGTVFGPWGTLINFDLGYSLYSDLPSARNQFTASLMFLKLI